ncbi:hypothetical protein [Parafrankia sp. EUN1f]|uniref:hypothetical protein n=1 Tax=Parafrankia sp. EUN1f TaxID=102897 RepID=UPI0001C46289|nr:hypothetical protein [Parafrankia sp. EUN1f]EFC83591.1 hypothetical protein FrEUN1fDRAFT_3288 [Parafrankia sp. EUN1f]
MTQGPVNIQSSFLDLSELSLRDLRHRHDVELDEGLRRVLAGIDEPDSRLIGGVRAGWV